MVDEERSSGETPNPVDPSITERMARVERSIAALSDTLTHQVRTRRLVVVDEDDNERIVGSADHGIAELRIELPTRAGRHGSLALVAFHGSFDGSPTIGVDLWADGNSVAGLSAWLGEDGGWKTGLHRDEDR